MINDCLLNDDTFARLLVWVLTFEQGKLLWNVQVEKLINGEKATANFDLELVLLRCHKNSFRPELIYSGRLPHEHNLELRAIRVIIYILGQFFISFVTLGWNIDLDICLEVYNELLKEVNLNVFVIILRIFHVDHLFPIFQLVFHNCDFCIFYCDKILNFSILVGIKLLCRGFLLAEFIENVERLRV